MTQFADAMETSPFPRLFVLDLLSDAERQSLTAADQPVSEQPRQCPLAAAAAAAAAAADDDDESAEAAVCTEVIFTSFYCDFQVLINSHCLNRLI